MKAQIILMTLFVGGLILHSCSKVEKDLDGSWNVTQLLDGGEDIVPSFSSGMMLTFSNVTDAGGDINLTGTDGSYSEVVVGTFTFNDDKSRITTTMDLPADTIIWYWDVSLEVSETSLTMDGTTTFSTDPSPNAFHLEASK